MMIETEDYTTWITSTGNIDGEPFTDYVNNDGKKWRIIGTCNACGLCESYEDSYTNIRINPLTKEKETYTRNFLWLKEPGEPGACIELNFEKRRDIPMTPDSVNTISKCTLTGEWLS
jgi:hypothetical protein